MSTVATRHPAILIRDAVNTVTTELVRADIAPVYMAVNIHGAERVTLSLHLSSRADLDAAESLFGPADMHSAYEGAEGEPRASWNVFDFMGIGVSCGAPAVDPSSPVDCEYVGGI